MNHLITFTLTVLDRLVEAFTHRRHRMDTITALGTITIVVVGSVVGALALVGFLKMFGGGDGH